MKQIDKPQKKKGPVDAAAVLTKAVDYVGGSSKLANLGGTTLKSERYFYIMGQGPEPGRGLMERPLTTTNVSRDYNSPENSARNHQPVQGKRRNPSKRLRVPS